MEFPQDFTARERALLGARFDELYAYATPQPARGVTVNALRCTPEWFAQHTDFGAQPSKFCPTAFTTAADFRPGRHAWHHAGVPYAQEPSASAPAALLDVQPGMRVADLCAAPGGKTSQLAAALQGQGLLLANEFVAARAEILRQNLERMGVTNAVITNEDTARLAAAMPGRSLKKPREITLPSAMPPPRTWPPTCAPSANAVRSPRATAASATDSSASCNGIRCQWRWVR